MTRDYGHSVSGLGPKQSVDDVARAIVRCVDGRGPRSTRTRCRRGADAAEPRSRPAFTDRFVRKFGRRRDAV